MYHNPVMLRECIEGLNIRPEGVYVDLTFGGGGHSQEILNNLGAEGRLIAFDQDSDAFGNIIQDARLILLNQNFRFMKNFLKLYKAVPVDGILADLGISSYQIDTSHRGFSTRFEGPLDMRMDQNNKVTAAFILNNYSEEKLSALFSQYGEISNAHALAALIVKAARQSPITTIDQLKSIIAGLVPAKHENKYLAQVFQSLRIEVNDELGALKAVLKQTMTTLKPGGRLVVMSYHSLEDRLVKNFMKAGNFEGEIEKDFFGNTTVPFKLISRKPIIAGEEELKKNPRARSAKLRIAEKV